MRPLVTIAWYTICEALHHRIILLAFSIVLGIFFTGNLLGHYLIGSYEKILLDCAFFSFQLFILLLNAFFAIPFFEKQKRYQMHAFFLKKGLTTSHFFYGVSLGFFCLLCSFCIVFYSLSIVILKYLIGQWFFHLLLGFLALAQEGVVLISIAIFFSLLLPKTLCYGATFAVYALCYTNYSYYLLPDLSLVDIKSNVMYELPLNYVGFSFNIAYIFTFSMLFLLGGHYIFQKNT